MEAFKYRAFISYSHRDRKWGDWLHGALESYRVPARLVGGAGRDGPVPARLYPIFRDREELPTSDDLPSQIRSALEQSQYLIVICSPASAESRWVSEEIIAYKRMGRENRILAIIVDGEPNAADKPALAAADGTPLAECFPSALKFRIGADGQLSETRTEPIAADAREHGDGRNDAKLKLIAGLLGVGFDALKQRDLEAKHARIRRLAIVATAVGVALVGLLSLAVLFALTSEATRNQALIAQSRFLAQASQDATASGDSELATLLALEALPRDISSPTRPVAIEALGALTQAYLDSRLRMIFRGHASTVNSAAFSPDGKKIVTASSDGTARVWDVATGRQLLTLRGHESWVDTAAFSPDGSRIVTASNDHTARIWDAVSGKQLTTLAGHESVVISAAYSPDGSKILTASSDHTARVWDAETGKAIAVLRGHGDMLTSAAFSPDGLRIVTASFDYTVRIWDSAGKQLTVLVSNYTAYSVAYSADGHRIVTSSSDGARVWDAITGKQLLSLPGAGLIRRAAFSPDGSQIATPSEDGKVRIWSAVTGTELQTLAGPPAEISSVSYSRDGREIVTASGSSLKAGADNAARVWSAAIGSQRAILRQGHFVKLAVFLKSGQVVLTLSDDNSFRIWNAKTGRLKNTMENASLAAFTPDLSKLVLTDPTDNTTLLLYLKGPKPGLLLPNVQVAAFSPDATKLATATYGTTRILDTATGKVLVELPHDSTESLVFSPNGASVLMAANDGTARIFDAVTGKQLTVMRGHRSWVMSAVFSSDGRKVLTGSYDQTARIWDADTGKQLVVLQAKGLVHGAAFSPDGTQVVTASSGDPFEFTADTIAHEEDNVARVWDVATGKQIAVLRGHGAAVRSATFSSDGTQIATASDDGTTRLWIEPPRCKALIDLMATRVTAARFRLSEGQRHQYFIDQQDSALTRLYQTLRPFVAWMFPSAGDMCN